MQMTLIERDDDITHVALSGRLDLEGLRHIDVQFHAVTAAARKPCIVELGGIEFVASLGIGMFFACGKSLHNHGVEMALYGATTQVAELLRRARLQEVMPIVATIEEALAAVSK